MVASASLDRTFVAIPATAALVTLTATAAALAAYAGIPWLRSIDSRAFGVLVLSAAFGNVMYLGLPVITQTLGARYGYVAVLYDLMASTPVVFTVGVFIAARSGNGGHVPIARAVRRVIGLPPLWGVAAGVLVQLTGVRVPPVVLDAASLMGKAVVPIMVFTVGLALDFRDVRRIPAAIPALGIKLLASPLLAWGIGSRLGLSGETLRAVTIEGAMPAMVLSLVIADEFELDVPLAAACIAVSTVAAFFTMPMMMRILF